MKTTNPNEPIVLTSSNHDSNFISPVGLTKREYFAAMAMQGLLASDRFIPNIGDESVSRADRLIKTLNASVNNEATS